MSLNVASLSPTVTDPLRDLRAVLARAATDLAPLHKQRNAQACSAAAVELVKTARGLRDGLAAEPRLDSIGEWEVSDALVLAMMTRLDLRDIALPGVGDVLARKRAERAIVGPSSWLDDLAVALRRVERLMP